MDGEGGIDVDLRVKAIYQITFAFFTTAILLLKHIAIVNGWAIFLFTFNESILKKEKKKRKKYKEMITMLNNFQVKS